MSLEIDSLNVELTEIPSKSKLISIVFHERPITDLKFHPDGDLLFSSSKDSSASMINIDGRMMGTFDNHKGAISTLDVCNNNLITAGLDLNLINWDILTGKVISKLNIDSITRGIDYNDNNDLFICTDNSMNKQSYLGRIDLRSNALERLYLPSDVPTKIFKFKDNLIFSTTSGKILALDLRTNKILKENQIHQQKINSIKPSNCRSFFITASTDCSSKIVDSDTLNIKKKFECDEPLNDAAIFNTNDKVVCVGGINARDVTTTKGKSSFDSNFFDLVTQKKIGCFTTHFGTINALDVHPSGKFYCSGGEDGSIALVQLGKDFMNAPFTKFD